MSKGLQNCLAAIATIGLLSACGSSSRDPVDIGVPVVCPAQLIESEITPFPQRRPETLSELQIAFETSRNSHADLQELLKAREQAWEFCRKTVTG